MDFVAAVVDATTEVNVNKYMQIRIYNVGAERFTA